MHDTVIAFGGGLKTLGGGRVGGYLVVFGSPDLEGEFFTADTDFDVDWSAPVPVSVYFNHGLDPALKKRTLARATLRRDDVGIWVETILQERDAYERAIAELARQGVFGWSSGSAPHLVERERVGAAYHLKRWPIVEASITHTPAEPRAQVVALKRFTPHPLTPAFTGTAGNSTLPEGRGEVVKADIRILEKEQGMEQKDTTLDAVRAQVDALSARLNRVMDFMERSPAIKNAGYFTVDGGKADADVKSFGDFLKAVQRGDHTRLTTVYATKALHEDGGASGGYLIAPEFQARLLEMMAPAAVVRPRATVIPVKSNTGSIPALNQSGVPTAGVGNTAFAGGVVLDWTEEGGSLPETDPDFDKIEWQAHKLAGRTKVSNELLADSGMIEAILMRLFARSIAAKEDMAFLRGDGIGKPQGILTSPAAVGITPDTNGTFAYADAVEMVSRFQPQDPSRCAWVIHSSLLTDLAAFQTGSGGAVFVNNIVAGMPTTLFGYPVLMSEHLPQADSSGCALLADFSAYVIFDRQQMAVAFSEHAAFTTDEGVWRVTERLDGQPWLRAPITQADPQGGRTTSPFVYFND